jgi:precorrin-8X/cobalt-precorrin-8 methylmutase
MALFDRYIAVDWSAANTPRTGKDSIWIADSEVASANPATRHEAMATLTDRLISARAAGQRVMLGFDFVFGYPQGAAEAIAGRADWQALWSHLAAAVTDNPDNSSNRFHVAAGINARLQAPHYWGHPHQHRYDNLGPRRPLGYATIPERRRAEMAARSAQPVWKLTGAGAVGSQSLLGIARLETLRRHPALVADIAVWPFDTAFAGDFSRPIAIVEIYPSLFVLDDPSVTPKDRAQVETCVRRFAAMDAAGELADFLDAPVGMDTATLATLLREEGWIAGVGRAPAASAAA